MISTRVLCGGNSAKRAHFSQGLLIREGEAIDPRRYRCRRVPAAIRIDGSLGDPLWAELPWSEAFVDITGREDRRPRYRTRIKPSW